MPFSVFLRGKKVYSSIKYQNNSTVLGLNELYYQTMETRVTYEKKMKGSLRNLVGYYPNNKTEKVKKSLENK